MTVPSSRRARRRPEFRLRRRGRRAVHARRPAGQTTVLVFYPVAFSPVCTDQFQVYEEVLDDFAAPGRRALRRLVRRDLVADGVPRAARRHDPAALGLRAQGRAARAFGAYFEPAGISNRALVIVDPDGVVQWRWEGEHPGDLPGANLIFDGLAGAAPRRPPRASARGEQGRYRRGAEVEDRLDVAPHERAGGRARRAARSRSR